MLRTICIIGLGCLLLVGAYAEESDVIKSKTTTTTTPPTTTTSTTTTTEPPTTSTEPPTTSSSTTTPIPTTPIPTTPAPITPLPLPDKGKWAFSDPKTNITCIIVQMAVQLNVSYENKDNATKFSAFNIPVNSTNTTKGFCGEEKQNITLEWPSSANLTNNNVFMEFEKNATSGMFHLTTMEFSIIQDGINFPDAVEGNKIIKLSHSENISIPLQKSYRCAKKQVIILEPNNAKSNSTMTIKDLQIEAFHSEKGYAFDSAQDCDFVDVPDIVPIAVGCALGGLILIVLITYLVGRRRSQTRGYLSM